MRTLGDLDVATRALVGVERRCEGAFAVLQEMARQLGVGWTGYADPDKDGYVARYSVTRMLGYQEIAVSQGSERLGENVVSVEAERIHELYQAHREAAYELTPARDAVAVVLEALKSESLARVKREE